MTDAVFDTTVFIDSYNGDTRATALMDAATAGRIRGAYSPITIYELWVRAMDRREEGFYNSVLPRFAEQPFTQQLGRKVAAWLQPLSRQRRLQLAAGAIIAATAASLSATPYTRNPRDFSRFYTNVQSY
jgi:predicted nucleic acid-binding protein